jgi:alpha-1,3-rhamnosyl/mannosyltransferase
MRIGLNLIQVRPDIGGGWNYVENLISAIRKHDNSNKYVSFVTPKSKSLIPETAQFEIVPVNLDPANRLSVVWTEFIGLERLVRKQNIDCMFWFGNKRMPTSSVPGLVVVHDLRFFYDPASYPNIRGAYLRLMTYCTARQPDATLLPVSKATAQHVTEYLNVPADQQVVTPVVIPDRFRPRKSTEVVGFRHQYDLPDKFWLYVSHTFTHKNHVRLLKAYRQLKDYHNEAWPLVLRGDPKDGEESVQEAIQALDLANDVYRLPRLSNEEMAILYSAASALIFPSTFEGGGIPVIEAMACRCPVVAAELPVIREFAHSVPLYVDPESTSSIFEKMMRMQSDENLQTQVANQGIQRAQYFSGRRVINKLQAVYDEL